MIHQYIKVCEHPLKILLTLRTQCERVKNIFGTLTSDAGDQDGVWIKTQTLAYVYVNVL